MTVPSHRQPVSLRSMSSPLKYATWNVNSVRARIDRVTAFLEAHRPDLVGIQELKCTDEKFPYAPLKSLGYHIELFGQPTYNGVALLSAAPITDVDTGLDKEARVIAGTAFGTRWINVYVPNGQRIGSEKYDYKLRWLKKLEPFLQRQKERFGDFVLMGDFNIIQDDLDVAHPDEWKKAVICDPVTRELVHGIRERLGLDDILRKHAPGPGVYTWWDYRTRGFSWNDGIRIDHIFLTEGLVERSVHAWVDIQERAQEKPSDHAPVLARLLPNGHPAT